MDNSKIFPSAKHEVLAMLYLQGQNLSGKTPEEVAELYQEAEDKICNYLEKKAEAKPGRNKQRVSY